ncbi:MAG: hypothetical protein KC800_15445 [Candidatus Eremiobacteraeota bacterium]|nr:hypothetical protein [Candidatus Eremiobacteraeota bacterium]
MKKSNSRRGFSLPELAVVMFLTTLITGVLVVFYSQSRLTLERGVTKTTLQQKTRIAATRIIPKITSVIQFPGNPNFAAPWNEQVDAIVAPLPSTAVNPQTDPGVAEIRLMTTKQFVKEQLRQPVLPADEFNPRWDGTQATLPYAVLRVWFEVTGNDPELGDKGVVKMDPDTPTIPGDDIVLASDLTLVSFMVYPDNRRVRLRVMARDFIKSATGDKAGPDGRSINTDVYETDIYLPVYTNSAGGSAAAP